MPKLQLQHTSMKIIIAMFYTSLVWGVWCDLRIIFLVGGLLCLHTTLLPGKKCSDVLRSNSFT